MVHSALLILMLETAIIVVTNSVPIIDEQLLVSGINADLLVTMREGTKGVLDKIELGSYADAAQKRTQLYEALTRHATNSQASLLDALTSADNSIQITGFWITNQVHIRNASANVLNILRGRPDVTLVQKAQRFKLDTLADSPASRPNTWSLNLEIMRVPQVWAHGINGTGVVVGIMDTGVRLTHEALRDSYKNDNYSWFDPAGRTTTPNDEFGHGTASMALLAGGMGVGVAFGAKWIACKAVNDQGEVEVMFLYSCAEFFLCPNPDCSEAPNIMSNGLNIPGDSGAWLESLLDKFISAGIIVVTSVGDYGDDGDGGCFSIGVPAHFRHVLSVGATNSTDGLWANSSQGPSTLDGSLFKPEVTAPGENIISACTSSDTSYCVGSGTDRAAAQVAGIVALLLSMHSWLRYDQIKGILQTTASRNLESNGAECGGVSDFEFPNFQFGHGRVDALSMYECVVDGECLAGLTTPGIEPSSTTEIASTSGIDPEDGGASNQTGPWLIAGLAIGGSLCTFTVLALFRRRLLSFFTENKHKSGVTRTPPNPGFPNDEGAVYRILRQFRNGVWPQLASLQEAYDFGDLTDAETDAIGNYLALTKPYKLHQFEIKPEDLQIDTTRLLGSGEFGIVYPGILHCGGQTESGVKVGVKKLKPGADANCVASFLKELQIMTYIGEHDNIIQIFGACTQTSYIDRMCIVLTLCGNGNLEKYLRDHRKSFVDQFEDGNTPVGVSGNPAYVYASTSGSPTPLTTISSTDLLRWTIEIASGMEFLASKKVVHGDLACRNVLLDDHLVVKVADFGLASRIYEYTRYVKAAEDKPLPWRWMAPESLEHMKFSTASDVWAFGITAWEVFTLAEVPYPGTVWCRQFLDALLAGYRNIKPKFATDEIHLILEQCWHTNAAERPTMAGVGERLRDILKKHTTTSESTKQQDFVTQQVSSFIQ